MMMIIIHNYILSLLCSSSKHSTVPTKLSQKQRKMLALATKEASVVSAVSKTTPAVAPPKSSGKAWWVAPG